jgi:hypothetical protein
MTLVHVQAKQHTSSFKQVSLSLSSPSVSAAFHLTTNSWTVDFIPSTTRITFLPGFILKLSSFYLATPPPTCICKKEQLSDSPRGIFVPINNAQDNSGRDVNMKQTLQTFGYLALCTIVIYAGIFICGHRESKHVSLNYN